MSDRKYLQVSEWQKLGGLQEANRLFFHPRGWALEVTRVEAKDRNGDLDGSQYVVTLSTDQYEHLRRLLVSLEDQDPVGQRLQASVEKAKRYDVGDAYLSGIWDCSDDPEGVVFGSWTDEDRAKVAAVEAERAKHREARYRLFYGDGSVEPLGTEDIEPTDWVFTR